MNIHFSRSHIAIAVSAVLVAGCASVPQRPAGSEQVRAKLTALQSDAALATQKGQWDVSRGVEEDHRFTTAWLAACQRLLRPSGWRPRHHAGRRAGRGARRGRGAGGSGAGDRG